MNEDMPDDEMPNEDMPEKVREELNKALGEVAGILTAANENLKREGLEEWVFPAGIIASNDPQAICEVSYFPVILMLRDENGNEIGFEEISEESNTAIYSPCRKEITSFKTTTAMSLSTGFCKKKRLGKPCRGSNGTLTCKKITIAGDSVYMCLPSK